MESKQTVKPFMDTPFQLFLCSTDPRLVADTVLAGIDGVLVEWEAALSAFSDEPDVWDARSVNPTKVNVLKQVRCATDQWVICRLNACGARTPVEIETAIDHGADEIWIPQISALQEAETVLAQVDRRCAVGIVIETRAALAIAEQLSALPLAHIHVGVNDLAEALGNSHSLCAIADGTIERLFNQIGDSIPYGCIGVTLPEMGNPIPGKLLIGELVRLGCRFGLLRRSFLEDTKRQNLPQAVAKIRAALQQASARTEEEKERDRQALYCQIETLLSGHTSSS